MFVFDRSSVLIAAHFEQRSHAKKTSTKKADNSGENEKLWSHDLATLWRRQRATALSTDPEPDCVCVCVC